MPIPLIPVIIALAGGALAAKKIADNMREDNLPMDEKAVDIALWGATEKLGRRKQPSFPIVFTCIVQLPFIPTTPNAPKMFVKIAELHGKGEDIATLMQQSLRYSSVRYNSADRDSPDSSIVPPDQQVLDAISRRLNADICRNADIDVFCQGMAFHCFLKEAQLESGGERFIQLEHFFANLDSVKACFRK